MPNETAATAATAQIWVGQCRFLGSDEWTNEVFLGSSKEDVERQILAYYNETVQAEDETTPTANSLDDVVADFGEFFYESWPHGEPVLGKATSTLLTALVERAQDAAGEEDIAENAGLSEEEAKEAWRGIFALTA